ncbi:hypothetical protein HRG_001745 [Hirsutella rhossiliensis]|uniref:Polyprotein n=1 Tax=Hirsutella rhossiliensis TaxID=111463 RepID=A0A9P8SMP0_9HYPO|nr:uncharacterized protein HRG_01745 [Hirsutella rhossiliensis]KAH0966336.1 hypothetical protein HRG_01745 [Hirsutella rhossiliensis]
MAKKFHIEDDDQILGVPQIPITTEELKPYEKTATRDEVHQYLSNWLNSSPSDSHQTRRQPGDSKILTGYVFLFLGGPVDWKATKQATVTTSSTEAELLALSSAAKEQMQFSRLIKELDIKVEGTNELWCDNLQTIRLLTELSAKLKTNLKHIDIHRHWLRQEVQEERLQITWIKSTENPADGMTKALPSKSTKLLSSS